MTLDCIYIIRLVSSHMTAPEQCMIRMGVKNAFNLRSSVTGGRVEINVCFPLSLQPLFTSPFLYKGDI